MLSDLDLPEKDDSQATVNVAPELIAGVSEHVPVAKVPSSPKAGSAKPAITLEEAKKRISPNVLAALSDKFNGSLTGIRPTDKKDIFFSE